MRLSPRRKVFIAFLTFFILGSGYVGLGYWNEKRHLSGVAFQALDLGLNGLIPFKPSWAWVYLLYYPACFIPLCFKRMWNSSEEFLRTLAGFYLQFLFCFAFFIFFPAVMLRPEISPAGFHERILLWVYQIDRPYNIFPSLHVANLVYVLCLVIAWGKKWAWGAYGFLTVLISLSTMIVRQHYLLDVLSGILVGWGAYFLAFKKPAKFGEAG